MSGARESCPGENELAEFFAGELPEERLSALEAHFSGCSACGALLTRLAAPGMTSSGHASGGDRPMPAPSPGDRVGRYILGAVLGSGAMGTVYSARDPDLGRTVALKLLRAEIAE